MKRFLLTTVFAASSIFAQSQALVQDALVLTGKSAALVANTAGFAIDTSLDMLILTGREVTEILDATLGTTVKVGQVALIQTTRLSKLATRTSLNIVKDSAAFTLHTADMGFDLVKDVLKDTSRFTLVVISDTGKFVFKAARGVLGIANFALKAVLNLIGIVL